MDAYPGEWSTNLLGDNLVGPKPIGFARGNWLQSCSEKVGSLTYHLTILFFPNRGGKNGGKKSQRE